MLQEGKWIWYPDDEIFFQYKQVMTRRTYRHLRIAPYWKTDFWYDSVTFCKIADFSQCTKVKVLADGEIVCYLDGKYTLSDCFVIPTGRHDLTITCYNAAKIPTIRVDSDDREICSDGSWQVNACRGEFVPVACRTFWGKRMNPNEVRLPVREKNWIAKETASDGVLFDMGEETFGFPKFEGISGTGKISLFYGESKEEALDEENCELTDCFTIDGEETLRSREARAFRYLLVRSEEVDYQKFEMDEEYFPVENKAKFSCSDAKLNRIFETSLRTMELTTREFFLDGIKRDRWVWSGDTYQSLQLNYYSYFDHEVVRQTLTALGGKYNVDMYINTIMEYTFYWILSIYDYYLYSGDLEFVRHIYGKIAEHLEFCLHRTDENGFMVLREGVWVFVDWAEMPKDGALCVEQILFCQALKRAGELGNIIGDKRAEAFSEQSLRLYEKIFQVFWKHPICGFIHGVGGDNTETTVTKYAAIFSVLFDLLTEGQKKTVSENVLMNDKIPAITTPYMKFYELAALMETGHGDLVIEYMRRYWGGMIAEGATTFWEAYDERQVGTEHYEMYGRKYGKSLCHAWGATPLVLIGKYLAGIRPIEPGYLRFEAKPFLGVLDWFEAKVPTNGGEIYLRVDRNRCTISSNKARGDLVLGEKKFEIVPGKTYVIPIDTTKKE